MVIKTTVNGERTLRSVPLVDELSLYGEKGKKITGVIAKLRENSPYFVLEESRIKRDECAFVGKKASYITVH